MITKKEYLSRVKTIYGKDSMWTKFMNWLFKRDQTHKSTADKHCEKREEKKTL